MDDLPLDMPAFEPGWVWLTGAGPGDAGLLTVLGLHGLRHADVVVYDALVGQGVLRLARPGAALEYAGKRGGKPSPSQADISHRLVQLAGEGKRVLRLKGGDPFVFGRGGEEALALARAGVPFRIVPGVTAGIGGLAYAGIPVTHRGINTAVTFVTGHDAHGKLPESVDWSVLAASPVLVFYMALKNLDRIAARLLAAGRQPTTPVAIISNATLARQKLVETTLGGCVLEARRRQVGPPAVIVVGEVVRLHAILDWWRGAAETAAESGVAELPVAVGG